jgi:hypothetical protein
MSTSNANRLNTRELGAVALMMFGLAACDDSVVQPGMITFTGPSRIVAPERAAARSDFQVVVYTFGNGCFSLDSTDVTIDGTEAIIEPYDRRDVDDACIQILVYLPHMSTLRFDSAGAKTIRVRGWDGNRQPTEVTLSIVVE